MNGILSGIGKKLAGLMGRAAAWLIMPGAARRASGASGSGEAGTGSSGSGSSGCGSAGGGSSGAWGGGASGSGGGPAGGPGAEKGASGALAGLAGSLPGRILGGLGHAAEQAGEAMIRASREQTRINESEVGGAPPSFLRLWRSFLGWALALAFVWEIMGRPLLATYCPNLTLPPSGLAQITGLLMGMLGLGF